VTALSVQVGEHPMPLAKLQIFGSLRTVFGTFFLLGFEDLAIGAASLCRAKQDRSDRYFLAISAFTDPNSAASPRRTYAPRGCA
jgi:hypothetical protein